MSNKHPDAQQRRVSHLILDDGKRPCSLGCSINTLVGGDHSRAKKGGSIPMSTNTKAHKLTKPDWREEVAKGQEYVDSLRREAEELDRLDKFAHDDSFAERAKELRRHAKEIEKWMLPTEAQDVPPERIWIDADYGWPSLRHLKPTDIEYILASTVNGLGEALRGLCAHRVGRDSLPCWCPLNHLTELTTIEETGVHHPSCVTAAAALAKWEGKK